MKRTNVVAHLLPFHGSALLVARRLRWPWTTFALAMTMFLVLGMAVVAAETWLVQPVPAAHPVRSEPVGDLAAARDAEEARKLLAEIDQNLAACRQARDAVWALLRNDLEIKGAGPDYASFTTPEELDVLIAQSSTLADAWSDVEAALRAFDKFDELQNRAHRLHARVGQDASALPALRSLAHTVSTVAATSEAGVEGATDLSVVFRTQELRRSLNRDKEP